jgi:hypothetical protein
MNPLLENQLSMTRRQFFGRSATGVGVAALASLLGRDLQAGEAKPKRFGGLPSVPHFAPKAKRAIYLFMNGGPTHVDMFDWKPKLQELHGKPVPEEYLGGKRFSTMTGDPSGKQLLAPLEKFQQYGKSGAWVSDLMPHTAKIVDELCFIKSMHTGSINHAPGISFTLSGSELPGRPTLGAWLSYGLGCETDDLPAFVVMTSASKGTTCGQIFYDFYWGSGFLPSEHQGVTFRSSGEPVLYLSNPSGMSQQVKRGVLDTIAKINEQKLHDFGDPEIAARIAQYEMAFRMQRSVPELADFSKEPKKVLESYGPFVNEPGSFARNCLMARRLIERGSRSVQLMHAGWDQHRSLTTELHKQCEDTDQPCAALVKDLKRLGLLDETLVIWGGEFGRTPFIQGNFDDRSVWGRDHHPYGFTTWLAGGGIKPGITYGETDDLGFNAVKDRAHVHDLQATILHQLGINHEKLTYKFQGRDFRLTDVEGEIVKGILV